MRLNLGKYLSSFTEIYDVQISENKTMCLCAIMIALISTVIDRVYEKKKHCLQYLNIYVSSKAIFCPAQHQILRNDAQMLLSHKLKQCSDL